MENLVMFCFVRLLMNKIICTVDRWQHWNKCYQRPIDY